MNGSNLGKSENLVLLALRFRKYELGYYNGRDQQASCAAAESVAKSSRAAVLICLFEDEKGEVRVILTKRSSKVSSNPGEVSLPGGKRDDCDRNDVDTALREAKEEIGLDPSIVEILAVLEPFHTKKNITVVPVVAILWDRSAFSPTLNADEVESMFDAPLQMFLKDESRRAEEREWMGYKYLLHYFDHKAESGMSYVIWALTAGILIKAASIAYQKLPEFEEQKPRFWTGGGIKQNVG